MLGGLLALISSRLWRTVLPIFLLVICLQYGVFAEDFQTILIPVAITPFTTTSQSQQDKKDEIRNGAKALVVTFAVTEVLKYTVQEERPDSDSTASFPSGHTALAFALATTVSNYNPEYKWLAYSAAAAVGWSRVEEGDHYWHDVIAGAIIGHLIANQYTKSHIGITPSGIGIQTSW